MPQTITVFTLIDITDTGTRRVRESNTKEYHQQQNFNVLLQTIGLRTQLFDYKVNIQPNNVLHSAFADTFKDETATIWSLTFRIETDSVWSDGVDELALLKTDLHGIAITSDLDNTVDFSVNIFDIKDNVNTYIDIN